MIRPQSNFSLLEVRCSSCPSCNLSIDVASAYLARFRGRFRAVDLAIALHLPRRAVRYHRAYAAEDNASRGAALRGPGDPRLQPVHEQNLYACPFHDTSNELYRIDSVIGIKPTIVI